MKRKMLVLVGLLFLAMVLLAGLALVRGFQGSREAPPGGVALPWTPSGLKMEAQAGPAPRPAGAEAPASLGDQVGSLIERMILYTAQISLLVPDVTQAMEAVTEIARDTGGYVASSNSNTQGQKGAASLSLRIPAQSFQETMSRLRRLALEVKEERTDSRDVSEEYADLEAQLRNLEATEAQYLALLKRAQTIDEILKVQQRLDATRAQIERTKGRMLFLERRAEMATITVTLVPAPPEGRKPWEPGRVAKEAWERSLLFLEGIANGLITVAVLLWWVYPLLLGAGLAWRLWWPQGSRPQTQRP